MVTSRVVVGGGDNSNGDDKNNVGDPTAKALQEAVEETASAITEKVVADGEAAAEEDPFAELGLAPLSAVAEFLKFLVVGPTGSGKTRLAASAVDLEQMRPIIFVDCDAGTLSIPADKRRHISHVKIPTPERLMKLIVALGKTRGRFKTIIVDDGVEFLRIVMGGVIDEQNKANPTGRDPEIPNRADYLRLQERARILIRFFRDYPAHFIMIAKSRDREDTDGSTVIKPHFSGVLADEFPGYFDIVGFLAAVRETEEEEVVRRLLLSPTRKVQWAKDRTDEEGTQSYIDNPSMEGILENFIRRTA